MKLKKGRVMIVARDEQLANLLDEEEALFQKKQAVHAAFMDAKKRAEEVFNRLEEVSQDLKQKQDEMDSAFRVVKENDREANRVWREYSLIRKTIGAAIDAIKDNAEYEHQEMIRCFETASQDYKSGNIGAATTLSKKGRNHKRRFEELNAEAKCLHLEIKAAHNYAEACAPCVDQSHYKALKAEYKRTRAYKEWIERKLKDLNRNCEDLKAEFDRLDAEYRVAREATDRREEELASELEKILKKISVIFLEGGDVKT